MTGKKSTLEIILEEWPKVSPKLSEDLIVRIFKAEERVQFDGDRRDITNKIRQLVQTALDEEFLKKGNKR